ncbi:MAG: hypothetical protein HYV67_03495 [Candidatus Taylorbacteria bacterium]|nr:hypothetical protein [Candidatus Taylorbacteria bacterium]
MSAAEGSGNRATVTAGIAAILLLVFALNRFIWIPLLKKANIIPNEPTIKIGSLFYAFPDKKRSHVIGPASFQASRGEFLSTGWTVRLRQVNASSADCRRHKTIGRKHKPPVLRSRRCKYHMTVIMVNRLIVDT